MATPFPLETPQPVGMSLAAIEQQPALLVVGPGGVRAIEMARGASLPSAVSGPAHAIAANDRMLAVVHGTRIRLIDRASGRAILDSTALSSPRGVAVSKSGDLYAVDAREGRLVRLTSAGVESIAEGFRHPVGLHVEGDDDAWVTEYGAGQVSYIDLKSRKVRPLVFALQRPTGVVRLPTGNLAIAERGRGRVLSVDPKTGERTPMAGGLALEVDDLNLPADTVTGLAVGPGGEVYVACPGDNTIVRLEPDRHDDKRGRRR